jgi:hypothetical protein
MKNIRSQAKKISGHFHPAMNFGDSSLIFEDLGFNLFENDDYAEATQFARGGLDNGGVDTPTPAFSVCARAQQLTSNGQERNCLEMVANNDGTADDVLEDSLKVGSSLEPNRLAELPQSTAPEPARSAIPTRYEYLLIVAEHGKRLLSAAGLVTPDTPLLPTWWQMTEEVRALAHSYHESESPAPRLPAAQPAMTLASVAANQSRAEQPTLLGDGGAIQFGVALPDDSASSREQLRASNMLTVLPHHPAFYYRPGSPFFILLHSSHGRPIVRMSGAEGVLVKREFDARHVASWDTILPLAVAPLEELYLFEFSCASAGVFEIEVPFGAAIQVPVLKRRRGYRVSSLVPHSVHVHDKSFGWPDKCATLRTKRARPG